MGEQTEMMVNGDVCEQCGYVFDDLGMGFPRLCSECDPEKQAARDKRSRRRKRRS